MKKIVFLDSESVDFGDISLKPLIKLGSFKAYPYTPSDKIISRIKDATVVVTNKCNFDESILKRLNHTKLIQIAATGVNNVDLKAARKLGVGVSNVVGYSTDSVVQCTFAFLLALSMNLESHHQAVQKGCWKKSKHFTLGDYPYREVAGKTLGIIGYGAIGKKVARVAKAFGMEVIIAKIPGRSYQPSSSVKRVTLSALFKKADFISIHAPLSPLTKNLITARDLRMMKPSTNLINMARGGIINEVALLSALKKKQIAGAATDVLSVEPPSKGNPLLKAPRLLMSPHIAWASLESRERLVSEMALNIQAFLKGKRRNRIV